MTKSNRLLFQVPLQPVTGSRFQPTGFPDLDAARFDRFDEEANEWISCLVVESAQSMANRLEATAWDSLEDEPVAVFDGLPYVRVVRAGDGSYLTSSRTEAHRLASAFVKDATLDGAEMKGVIGETLNLLEDRPIPLRDVARAVFALDPFCLIHGVFFADKKWPGQPKVTRALMSEVEASDVRRAESGGVKKDDVRHSITDTGGSSEGYGTIPFHRTEWTARRITASFSLDRAQLRSYGLPEKATALLDAIARWEVRSLLDGSLRFRTACDLEPAEDEIVARSGEALGSIEEITEEVRAGIAECEDLLGPAGPIEVQWSPSKKS